MNDPFTPEAKFDFYKFRTHVDKAMRMMDDIIDLELEKVEQIIRKIVRRLRPRRRTSCRGRGQGW